MSFIRIDGLLANPDYNNELDKEWVFAVSLVDETSCEIIEQRKITIHRLACGFDSPNLSDVIKKIEDCKTLDEIIEKVSQSKPTNSMYDKRAAQNKVYSRGDEHKPRTVREILFSKNDGPTK